ncbi:MAG: hypothetical protein PHO61_03245 [Candidatus ainarchaeum sp.]|jgi:hypothetical protein|nr:hypothetical protein [Candidatus ainarchaeum sp.]MDD3086233.1 hypothetical protein [Candidatus ainarchaeum sp.]HPM86150.1 hypothetical protein [archaeon]
MIPLLVNSINPNLLFIGELFGDMNFVLKIFVLMTIVSYVTQHLGKGPIALIVIAVIGWMIFSNFAIFGSIYVIYMLVLFGVTQILMDFFILAPQAMMEQNMQGGVENQPNGADMQDRQRKMMQMRQKMGMF